MTHMHAYRVRETSLDLAAAEWLAISATSYWDGSGFEYRPVDRLLCLKFFVFSFRPTKQMVINNAVQRYLIVAFEVVFE